MSFRETLWPIAAHPVPKSVNWWYVFGSGTLILFLVQVVTGSILAFLYVPSAAHAYDSLVYLNQRSPLGWWLRGIHFFGASFMVAMIFIHMTRVFLTGSYKYPRELNWVTGVFLLFLTLGIAFTGQILRWDQDGYWTLAIGAEMAGRVPLIGPALVHVFIGGPTIAGGTLTRMFALHVFVLPGLIFAFIGVHLYLLVKRGISERPVAGLKVDPKTYEAHYDALLRSGKPFVPDAFHSDMIFAGILILAVTLLALFYGPAGPLAPPDPTLIHANPRPDWYFLSYQALLAFIPSETETWVILLLPIVLAVALFAVPFVSPAGERHIGRRPLAALSVSFVLILFVLLTYEGYHTPFSPHMEAWSGAPVPVDLMHRLSPVELEGAVVFQNKGCRNCHELEGVGGLKGPSLTDVGIRIDRAQMVAQISRGSENMPAFGGALSSDELDVLTRFLQALVPPGWKPRGMTAE